MNSQPDDGACEIRNRLSDSEQPQIKISRRTKYMHYHYAGQPPQFRYLQKPKICRFSDFAESFMLSLVNALYEIINHYCLLVK